MSLSSAKRCRICQIVVPASCSSISARVGRMVEAPSKSAEGIQRDDKQAPRGCSSGIDVGQGQRPDCGRSPWSDPFANMRLSEDSPTREPWQIEELRLLFTSAVFTGARPKGGRGEAAFWLPLLGLYTGARLSELAALTAADVTTDDPRQIPMITIREDLDQDRRLKTACSARVVPVHPEFVRSGFCGS